MQYVSSLRSFYRLTLFFSLLAVAIPIQAVARLLRLPLAKRLPRSVHRGCVWILSAKLEVRGKRVKKGAVMFVANHTSYLDISVLGALIQNGAFVAKSEVATWPVFGLCAKLQNTVFVDRRSRLAGEQAEKIRDLLRTGGRLILFPEGTSNDGNHVLPFRSALFAAAETRLGDAPVKVQPVSIAYTHLDGIPMGRHLRPFFAWYGDMELASHLWQLMGIGRVRVVVEFHEPVTIDRFRSRKEMATYCQAVVAAGVSRALSGRDQPAPALPPPAASEPEPEAGEPLPGGAAA